MKFFSFCLAFFLVNLSILSQKNQSTIFLRNGDTLECLAKIKNNGEIKIIDGSGKKKTLNHRTVKRIEHGQGWGTGNYEYKIAIGKNIPLLLEIISEGRLTVYGQKISTSGGAGLAGGTIMELFVGREGENTVTDFHEPNRAFASASKELAIEYFSDCPGLIEKIRNKEIKPSEIDNMAEYYNSECSNK